MALANIRSLLARYWGYKPKPAEFVQLSELPAISSRSQAK